MAKSRFAVLFPLVVHYLLNLFLDVRFCSYFFLYILNVYLLYMFNGIILYVSCTKINGKHLSTKTQTSVQR